VKIERQPLQLAIDSLFRTVVVPHYKTVMETYLGSESSLWIATSFKAPPQESE
jgi:hypothetical protein